MSFAIRPLVQDDAAAYRAIRLEALRDHPEAFASSYEVAAARPPEFFAALLEKLQFFGAFSAAGELVGIVAFEQSDGDREKHRGWLLQMYVRPQMRGTGCAMALVETLLAHARERVLQVHLGVASHNEAAIRLYARAGFVRYGTDPRFLAVDGRYVDEDLMVRFLDEAPERERNE